MKRKVYIASVPLLVIAMLLTLAVSCGRDGAEKAPSGTPSAKRQAFTVDNAVAQVTDAAGGLKSFHFDIEMTWTIDGVVDGESGHSTISAKSNGAMDLANEQMKMEAAMSIKGEGPSTGVEGGRETIDEAAKMAIYLVEGTVYSGIAESGGQMSWKRQRATRSNWAEQDVQKRQLDLLKNSKIKLLRTEKVNGVQSHVLEVEPDPGMLWETLMRDPGMKEALSGLKVEETFKKVVVKYWFAKDTLVLMKAYVYMAGEGTPKELGMEGEGSEKVGKIKMTIEQTMEFSKHNQSVQISVPAEAKE